jgi:hypothetical protein
MVNRIESPARGSRDRGPDSHVGSSLLVRDGSWKSRLSKRR